MASTSSCVSSGVAPSTTGRTNPMVTDLGQARDRHQLQQIIAGLREGVILIEPGQRIVWGNEAALAMHGVESLEDLGATVDAYRRRFRLRYRNNRILKKSDYPLARVIAGETFSDVTVEVCAAGKPAADVTRPREVLCQLENLSAREPYRLISVSVGRTSE